MIDHERIMARVAELQATGETEPRLARDPVNQPMINNWVEAIGDADPGFTGPDAVAPPAMAQVWTMYGLDPTRPAGDPLHATMRMFDEAGYTSVLGTNCDQTYARPLRPGEQVSITSRLDSVVGPKRTGVGEGYFVTTLNTWRVGDEEVATMLFRVLKFKPAPRATPAAADPSRVIRPQRNRDTEFYWEGTAAGELRIQKCNACGELRHPPGPVCPVCHAMDRGHVVASGRGTVYSFAVHHAPQLPGKELPLRLAVVELEEGVRMVGELKDADGVQVGDPVRVRFEEVGDDLTLAMWEPDPGVLEDTGPVEPVVEEGALAPVSKPLPVWHLPITPTLVVSTAIATRDFQDVHHDRDLAVQRGSKDIFLNILTTTGLVQRYVGEWARASFGTVRITACALRLGAPAYPGDTLTFTGTVSERTDDHVVVDVVGAVSLGNHVNARITLEVGR